MNNDQNSPAESWHISVPKLVTFAAGGLYVLGFIVVTFYLAQFSITPSNWLQAEYLLAGFWCLVPIFIFILAIIFIAFVVTAEWMRYSMDVPRRTLIYRYTIATIYIITIAAATLVYVSQLIAWLYNIKFSYFGVDSIIALKVFGVVALAIAIGLFGIINLTRYSEIRAKYADRVDRQIAILGLHILFVAGSIYLFFVYIWYFSTTIYSVIPSEYGGGKPETVVFVLRSPALIKPELQMGQSQDMTVPYKLLLQTEDSYIVKGLNKSVNNIQIQKNTVVSMLVLNNS